MTKQRVPTAWQNPTDVIKIMPDHNISDTSSYAGSQFNKGNRCQISNPEASRLNLLSADLSWAANIKATFFFKGGNLNLKIQAI